MNNISHCRCGTVAVKFLIKNKRFCKMVASKQNVFVSFTAAFQNFIPPLFIALCKSQIWCEGAPEGAPATHTLHTKAFLSHIPLDCSPTLTACLQRADVECGENVSSDFEPWMALVPNHGEECPPRECCLLQTLGHW